MNHTDMENMLPENTTEEAKGRKKHSGSFFLGLLSGLLLVTAGIAISTRIGVKIPYAATQTEGQYTSGSNTVNQTLIDKLNFLEQCVDQFFLFDSAQEQEYREAIYKGFLEALGDPYSCYYTAEEYQLMMESTSGSYEGIGVVVSQNATTKLISVVRPFPGCPGAEAGMLPGDVITKIADTDVTGMDLNTAVSLIKGKGGTAVSVEVFRESDGEYHTFSIVRRKIEVPTVEHEMLEGQIGYVSVSDFDGVTEKQFVNAVEELKQQGMEALVIDLRGNPGGRLDIVVNMLDYLLPEGKIVYTEDKYGEGDTYTSDAEHFFELPLAVLVNGNSASASEVFAGAIQDYGIGTIVGTQTFGKGIVQQIFSLNDGSAVKLTISRYFTPNGRCIHEVGITPDVVIELEEELRTKLEVAHEEDNQLQEAVRVIKEQMTSAAGTQTGAK